MLKKKLKERERSIMHIITNLKFKAFSHHMNYLHQHGVAAYGTVTNLKCDQNFIPIVGVVQHKQHAHTSQYKQTELCVLWLFMGL